MNQRRILLLLADLVVAAILAFFLQDVIRQAVVTPLAYLWWVLKYVYSFIPELVLWILLLAVLVLVVITSLSDWYSIGRARDKPSRPVLGPVEIMAGWVSNIGEGNYYKWVIAHRLGKLAGEINDRMGDPGHPPSIEVQRYLKAGLTETFVDYPLPSFPFMPRKATPFDLDVEAAVEFLESQLEARSGKKHQ